MNPRQLCVPTTVPAQRATVHCWSSPSRLDSASMTQVLYLPLFSACLLVICALLLTNARYYSVEPGFGIGEHLFYLLSVGSSGATLTTYNLNWWICFIFCCSIKRTLLRINIIVMSQIRLLSHNAVYEIALKINCVVVTRRYTVVTDCFSSVRWFQSTELFFFFWFCTNSSSLTDCVQVEFYEIAIGWLRKCEWRIAGCLLEFTQLACDLIESRFVHFSAT